MVENGPLRRGNGPFKANGLFWAPPPWRKTSALKRPITWNCLQWGWSNSDDPTGWPKIGLLNWLLGSILLVFPKKNGKTQSSLDFFQSGPRKFTKLISSGLAPIQRVLNHYEARKDYTNNSGTVLLCNRCVRNRKTNSQRVFVCNWHLRKVPPGCARITILFEIITFFI